MLPQLLRAYLLLSFPLLVWNFRPPLSRLPGQRLRWCLEISRSLEGWAEDIDGLAFITRPGRGLGKNGWWLPSRSDGTTFSERRLLISALDMARERLDRKRKALETEIRKNEPSGGGILSSSTHLPYEVWPSEYKLSRQKSRRSKMLWEISVTQSTTPSTSDVNASASTTTAAVSKGIGGTNVARNRRKNPQLWRGATVVRGILVDVEALIEQLTRMRAELCHASFDQLSSIRCQMENELGLGPLLETAEAKGMATRIHEWGRPDGFTGPVFISPHGVPILVAGRGDSESLMRHVSQGTDLWFKVRDGRGSGVLLRTSMCRGMKGSRECAQLAANLAAYFSDRRGESGVEVMYTDPQKVNKRGSRSGSVRDRKKLGTLISCPYAVTELVKENSAL